MEVGNKKMSKKEENGKSCDVCYWANKIGECQLHNALPADNCVDYERDTGWN